MPLVVLLRVKWLIQFYHVIFMSTRIAWLKIASLFPRVVIGEGARLNMLSWTRVLKLRMVLVIRGTAEHPVVVKKGAKVTEDIHS